jgi:hypothetical protein
MKLAQIDALDSNTNEISLYLMNKLINYIYQ